MSHFDIWQPDTLDNLEVMVARHLSRKYRLMKQRIRSGPPQPTTNDNGTDMVLRIFEVARLLERAAAQSEEGTLKNSASENHESQDSRYCHRERDLS